jgi:hypothetical protein
MANLEKFLSQERFIILGGHKCGTSSLHYYIGQHPEIVLPHIKGEDILNRRELNITTYQNSYPEPLNKKVIGEVSSTYLYSEMACKNIQKYLSNSKLIAILRNPSERAFSNFNVIPESVDIKLDREDFFQHLDKYLNQPVVDQVLKKGLYYENLNRYLQIFPREQIKIFTFDEFLKDQKKFMYSLFEFINVDPNFTPDTSVIIRKGGKITNHKLETILKSGGFLKSTIKSIIRPFTTPEQRRSLNIKVKNLLTKKEFLSPKYRQNLIDFYREDILKTQELLNIDLSHWLQKN